MTGTVIWVTGRPASGKSTFASGLRARLAATDSASVILDSDEVRKAIFPDLGYSSEERDRFYAALTRIATLLARQGLVVIVAATANLRAYRERARALAPRYLEVFIATPPEECRARDPKGLYAGAQSGRAATLPGAGAAYEPPEKPDVVASGGLDDAAVERVVAALKG